MDCFYPTSQVLYVLLTDFTVPFLSLNGHANLQDDDGADARGEANICNVTAGICGLLLVT